MDGGEATALAAFIGAASALITVGVKDFALVRLNRRWDKASDNKDVLRLYVAPLAAASEKLVWRFAEVFIDKRHQFLKAATLPLVFNEYKRQSTLYRVATLIGWMRAVQLELDALPKTATGLSSEVGAAVEKVRKALADGPEVELLRLKQLLAIWQLGDTSPQNESRLAGELERRVYSEAGNKLKHDASYLQKLDRPDKVRIARSLADFLSQAQGKAKISDPVLEEKIESAMLGMSYREALIYRDWQDAIGDSMLIRDEDSERRYKTIGYADFADLLNGPEPWMEVFRESIIDIDFEAVDASDYRGTQLGNLSAAVSDILIAVSGTEHKDLVSKETLDKARQLAALHQGHS